MSLLRVPAATVGTKEVGKQLDDNKHEVRGHTHTLFV
jgi:hypothetical protein